MSELENKEVSEVEVSNEITSKSIVNKLIDDVTLRISSDKELLVTLKKLSKEIDRDHKRLTKNNKIKRKIKQTPQKVTKPMNDFISANFPDKYSDEAMYTRQDLMKLLSAYIKKQDIQNPENKKQWSGTEKTLKKIFGLDQQWYTFMQINGLLTGVIIK